MSDERLASVHLLRPSNVPQQGRLRVVAEQVERLGVRWYVVPLLALCVALGGVTWPGGSPPPDRGPDPTTDALYPGSDAQAFGPRMTPYLQELIRLNP